MYTNAIFCRFVSLLTFDAEVGGADDTFSSHEVSGTLTGVVGVVYDPVQTSAWPPVENVKDQAGVDRFKVVGGRVGCENVWGNWEHNKQWVGQGRSGGHIREGRTRTNLSLTLFGNLRRDTVTITFS